MLYSFYTVVESLKKDLTDPSVEEDFRILLLT